MASVGMGLPKSASDTDSSSHSIGKRHRRGVLSCFASRRSFLWSLRRHRSEVRGIKAEWSDAASANIP